MAFLEWPCRPLPASPALQAAVCPVAFPAALSRQGREVGWWGGGRRKERVGLSLGGRSLYSSVAWSKPESPGIRAGPGALLGGRPWGEDRGVLPTLREPAWLSGGWHTLGSRRWGKAGGFGELTLPASKGGGQVCREGRGRRCWEGEAGPREPAQIWREPLGLEKWVLPLLLTVGPGGGHRGCGLWGVRRPCDH